MRRTASILALAAFLAFAAPSTAPPAHLASPGPAAAGGLDILVVGFQGPIPADAEAWAASLGGVVETRVDDIGMLGIRMPDGPSVERAAALASARGDVRYAERDGWATIALVPNDPRYGEQWGFPAIFAPQAWDITVGTHAAKVSVLDTGIQTTHPDLKPNACGPFTSFVPSEPTIDDFHGHGTHVSGTVAAVTNNALGVAGTSQSCVMGAKVLAASGGGAWSWIAAGVVWSANNGADVVSMSIQGGFSQAMKDAVDYAYLTKDVLVVSAAGNYGCSPGVASILRDGSIAYPGAYDNSMAVAALQDPGIDTASFSSCGADMEIAAPGQGVLSLFRGSGYAYMSGTSMATPHVSGVAALVLSQNPSVNAVRLRCLLDLSSDELPPLPGRDFQTGWGRLNAQKALAMDKALADAGAYGAFEQACRAGARAIME